jgi:hypothetical protein
MLRQAQQPEKRRESLNSRTLTSYIIHHTYLLPITSSILPHKSKAISHRKDKTPAHNKIFIATSRIIGYRDVIFHSII